MRFFDLAIRKKKPRTGGCAGLLRFLLGGTVMGRDAHHMIGILIVAYVKMTAL
jgi:hypothetical protein